MTTIAIVGAGAGLGLAVGRRFGREGFSVALLARDQTRVQALAASLGADGITAIGFTADVRDAASLTGAFTSAADQLGPIEVLQYSPVPAKEFMLPVLETGVADLVGPVAFSVYGPVTSARQVLPGMVALGRGTMLFVNGASAVRPRGSVAGTSIAFAAEGAYAQLLHEALLPLGIHVAQPIIPRAIGGGETSHEPDTLAETLWNMHTVRAEFRTYAALLD